MSPYAYKIGKSCFISCSGAWSLVTFCDRTLKKLVAFHSVGILLRHPPHCRSMSTGGQSTVQLLQSLNVAAWDQCIERMMQLHVRWWHPLAWPLGPTADKNQGSQTCGIEQIRTWLLILMLAAPVELCLCIYTYLYKQIQNQVSCQDTQYSQQDVPHRQPWTAAKWKNNLLYNLIKDED